MKGSFPNGSDGKLSMNVNRQKAAGFLREYRLLCRSEKSINEQMCVIDRIMKSVSVSNPSAIPNCGGGSRYEDYLVNQIAKKDELRLRLAIVGMRKEMIMATVDRLSPKQRAVIDRFFISGGSERAADDLMELLAVEKSQVYRIKDAALDAVYRMMNDGREESLTTIAE